MERIVFLDRDTLARHITLRAPDFEHEWVNYDRTAAEQVAARAQGASILITNKVPITAATLATLPDLKMIAVAATGLDAVDVEATNERGVFVKNVTGYAATSVAEHTFALILALSRQVPAFRRSILEGRWQEADQFSFFDHPIADLSGKTLGIIGRGSIGLAVGRLAEAFGMEVQFAGRKGRRSSQPPAIPFEHVLMQADVLTLHCPLTEETKNLIGEAEFALMAKKPLLINTARGGLVDEDALVAALDQGLIAGAGFDVASQEPPPKDHPLMRIAGRDNVILTPHIAWASDEAMSALAEQLIENIENYIALSG
ncbi:MAG: D-2-hydroxyacid dehydrogenase [Pseudomonadota bacterium]